MITVNVVGASSVVDCGACGAVRQPAIALELMSKNLEPSNGDRSEGTLKPYWTHF
jgi:hypothetical protein